uniref:Uncharacterized protein n=1 Tax=Rhizophora mucronata TaxID=61149 RepID=A0A2P2NVD5_RHIMU
MKSYLTSNTPYNKY